MSDPHDSLGAENTARGQPAAAGVPSVPEASVGDVATHDAAAREPALGRVDRYVLLARVGQGGFGAVYRARDTIAGIEVALKALPPLVARNPEELERVRENFALVTKLAHPKITNVRHLHKVREADADIERELGVSKDDYLVVMDFVSGRTLSSWRREHADARAPVDAALRVCTEIAEVLDYAHSQKIIHRDIKPSNVIVTPDEEVRILDFGLAAEIRSSMSRVSTQTGESSGTPPYMAPEQWAGKRQEGATDQYALAVLLYELISGGVPFASAFETNDRTIMMNVVKDESPEPLSELTAKQNQAVLRALSKDPEARHPSCGDFVAALRGASGGRRGFRVGHLAAALFVLLLLLAAAGRFGFQQWRSSQDAKREQARLAELPPAERERFEELLAGAQTAFDEKDFSKTFDLACAALELDNENPTAVVLRCEALARMGPDDVIPVLSQAKQAWDRTRGLDPGQGLRAALAAVEVRLHSAAAYYEGKDYGTALEEYRGVLAECARLQQLDKEREAARPAREAAEKARQTAESADAEQDAPRVWLAAAKLATSAGEAFEGGKFAESETSWRAASAEFAKAAAQAEGVRSVRGAKSGFEEDLAMALGPESALASMQPTPGGKDQDGKPVDWNRDAVDFMEQTAFVADQNPPRNAVRASWVATVVSKSS